MSGRHRVELGPRAERELRSLRSSSRDDFERVVAALEALGMEEPALDVRPLEGRRPWLRLRVGDFRILFRRLSEDEAILVERTTQGRAERPRFHVARIVNRRDLELAVRRL